MCPFKRSTYTDIHPSSYVFMKMEHKRLRCTRPLFPSLSSIPSHKKIEVKDPKSIKPPQTTLCGWPQARILGGPKLTFQTLGTSRQSPGEQYSHYRPCMATNLLSQTHEAKSLDMHLGVPNKPQQLIATDFSTALTTIAYSILIRKS